MVMRVGNSLVGRERRTDKEGRAASPRDYKEVPKDPLHITTTRSYYTLYNISALALSLNFKGLGL